VREAYDLRFKNHPNVFTFAQYKTTNNGDFYADTFQSALRVSTGPNQLRDRPLRASWRNLIGATTPV
jgi:hypothetical protein